MKDGNFQSSGDRQVTPFAGKEASGMQKRPRERGRPDES
jgi:hypothetical protein